MIRLREALFAGPTVFFTLLAIICLGYLRYRWSSHFRALEAREKKSGEKAVVKLHIANLLSAISLGITGVSILLPAVGAILLYYLRQVTSSKLSTAYPLVVAISFFGLSLLLGLWNAFSFATQYSNGETAEWDKRYMWHALFFAAQFLALIVGVLLLLWFFWSVPLIVEDLPKKSGVGGLELWEF